MERESLLERFASEAIRLGADEIEFEYRDGYEEVTAIKNSFGFGIGRIPSSSPESDALRDELQTITRRKRAIIVVDNRKVELRATTFDNFGETAYLVKLT